MDICISNDWNKNWINPWSWIKYILYLYSYKGDLFLEDLGVSKFSAERSGNNFFDKSENGFTAYIDWINFNFVK